MYTKTNFKGFFTVPAHVDGAQKNVIGGATESLQTIVGNAFDHTTPEYASLITQKAAELNALIVSAYTGPNWISGKNY